MYYLIAFLFIFIGCSHQKYTDEYFVDEAYYNKDYQQGIKLLLNKPVSKESKILNELDLAFFYFLNKEFRNSLKLIKKIESKIENSSLFIGEKINILVVSHETNKYLLEEHEYNMLLILKIFNLIELQEYSSIVKINNLYQNKGIYYLQGMIAELIKDYSNAKTLYKKSNTLTSPLDISRIESYQKGYSSIKETIILINSGLGPFKEKNQNHPTIPTYVKKLNLNNLIDVWQNNQKVYPPIELFNSFELAKNKEKTLYKSLVVEDFARFSIRELLAIPVDLTTGGLGSIMARIVLHKPDGGDFRYWKFMFESVKIVRLQNDKTDKVIIPNVKQDIKNHRINIINI